MPFLRSSQPGGSLRQQMLRVAMLTTLAALLVSIAGVIAYDLRQFHRAMVGELAAQAQLIGHMSLPALVYDDARLAQENLALLALRPAMRGGALYTGEGRLFAAYSAPDSRQAAPLRPGPDGVGVAASELWLFYPVLARGSRVGTVYLRAAYPFWPRLLDYLLIGAVTTGAALALGYWLMRRLAQSVTAPVTALTALAREIVATRDYSRRAPAPPQREGELADLVEAVNGMLAEIGARTHALEAANAAMEHEVAQRRAAQEEVMRLNSALEGRVRERTAQLEAMNAELGEAIAAASAANQAKTAFLSSMSHELRTPLNAVLGFAQILATDQLPASAEQKREFAQHILKSGRHLLTLINEILDLAKIESGALALSLEPVALAEVLLECRAMVEPLAQQRGIRVLFPEQAGARVQADRTRLKQVLLNLLTNAVKYNREQGAVVLDCASAARGRLRLSVQDTGHGLSEQQLAHLFEPFNRLGQESGIEEGTGIGLVVTRRLVELMGGSIGVSSSLGVGTVFWIELALAAAQPAPAQAPTEAALTLAEGDCRHTVLYVEDNPANLLLVQEVLRYRPGLCLLTAADGHSGIEIARARRPDLILMDLNLPGLSGQDALIELRRDPATADIPVIALTANAMPREIERGMALGFARYLTKPLNLAEFTAAIDSALARAEATP
ncbi:ATP-binding protein [Massilia sp. TS11]|uniref:ATP-binding protein n=1 Tax=Massilia sp. TS11 TaxID=2908003 RepID=UPI001ED9CB92|nr:ATP-binding protein [Massilia sp. TS11]MCG2586402.1 ATP-binding protein [Massilia sp. TS11]